MITYKRKSFFYMMGSQLSGNWSWKYHQQFVLFIYLTFWLVVKESDLHTKRTGHTEFVDKTSETAKPISLEVPKATDEPQEVVDESNSKSSQPQGIPLFPLFHSFFPFSGYFPYSVLLENFLVSCLALLFDKLSILISLYW